MLPFFFVQNNVAFLKFDMLRDYDLVPITDRIKDVLKTCKFGYSLCSYYTRDCDGHFLLYLENGENIKTIHHLLANVNKIVAVAKVILFEHVIELYDVCTDISKRKNGYMKRILTEMIKTFGNKDIWLGVEYDNPNFDNISEYYVNLGFGNPESTTKSTQGTILRKPVLSLTFPTYQNKEKILQKIKLIKETYKMDTNKSLLEHFLLFAN